MGKELDYRLFYTDEVYAYFEPSHLQDETLLFLDQLRENYSLPKKTEEQLKKALAIGISRIKRQRFLSEEIPYFTNELRESELMEKLIYHVELNYQISLSQYEQDFLSYPLNLQFIDGLVYKPSPSDNLERIYQAMISEVKEKLDIDFDQEKLFQNLQTHFKFLIPELKGELACVVADCGYSSFELEVTDAVRHGTRAPRWLQKPLARVCVRILRRNGLDLEAVDTTPGMAALDIPILFFHGDADTFVPLHHSERNLAACGRPQRLVIVPGAEHAMSALVDPERYRRELLVFLWRNTNYLWAERDKPLK